MISEYSFTRKTDPVKHPKQPMVGPIILKNGTGKYKYVNPTNDFINKFIAISELKSKSIAVNNEIKMNDN